MAKNLSETTRSVSSCIIPYIDDTIQTDVQTPLLTVKNKLRKVPSIVVFLNDEKIETKIVNTKSNDNTHASYVNSSSGGKRIFHQMKIYAPFVFLLLICGLPLLIKVAPVKPHKNVYNSENSKLIIAETDLMQKLQMAKSPSTTKTPPPPQVSVGSTTPSPNDFIVNQIIYRLKNNLINTLVAEKTRLKTQCANAYVAIREHVIIAKANEERAFTVQYTLIEILRMGHYVALRNPHSNLYICYDENGFVKPTPQSNVSDLCIYRMKIRNEISTAYREFYSASRRYSNSLLQFKYDGYALKAQLSAPMTVDQSATNTIELYKKLTALRVVCPQFNGLILHKTQLDDVSLIENKAKQVLLTPQTTTRSVATTKKNGKRKTKNK